jgi:large subunit ribosomal protein L21
MYAVIRTGGKMYRVEEGQKLKVEKLEVEAGSNYDFNEILFIQDGDKSHVGTPSLNTGKVSASVLSHGRHKKIEIIKFKRRKNYRRQMGHRQHYTEIKIDKISA